MMSIEKEKLLVERAKLYLKKLEDGINPVTDESLADASAFQNERMSHCFGFISDILSEYIKLRTKFNGIDFEASGNLNESLL